MLRKMELNVKKGGGKFILVQKSFEINIFHELL